MNGVRGERLLLVPLIDMANHAHGIGGEFSVCPHSGDVTLLAGSDLAPGDEVLLDYGARPTDEFLLQYGFVPIHNPHDETVVQLSCGGRVTISWSDARNAAADVRAACDQALREMPTSLTEDSAALRQASDSDLGEAVETALRYRVAKKSLLAAVAGHAVASAETSAFAAM